MAAFAPSTAVASTTMQTETAAPVPIPGADCEVGFRDLLTVIDAYNSNGSISGIEVEFPELLRVIELYNSGDVVADCSSEGTLTVTTIGPTTQTLQVASVDGVDVMFVLLLLTAALALRRWTQ